MTLSTTSMEALARLRRPRRPRAIILAPTRELARQILSVLKSISHFCKISSELLVGGDDYGSQRKRMENRAVDILVATPGRLVKHRDAGDIYLGSVRHVVIDEFDTMLEQGFQNDIGKLLHPMLYKKKAVAMEEYKGGKLALVEGAPQIILTTATMTPAVRRLLDKPDLPFTPKRVFGKQAAAIKDDNESPNNVKIALPRDIRVLTAPGLHRVVPRLKQVFVNVGSVDKLSLLVDLVAGGERQKRERMERGDVGSLPLTLVFCNTVSSCRAAEHALAESGVASLCYHGDLSSDAREENLQLFRRAGSEGRGDDDDASVLVCTDIASRGLDVPQVDHVIMFDFPLNPIDYLHRAGRTARGLSSSTGGDGKVTALVTKRDQVLARAIEGAVQRGESLEGLSSRKSDYQNAGAGVASSFGRGGGGRDGGRGRGGRSGRGRGSGRGGLGRRR
jgi:superfamily II DNA/RNA helicase